MMKKRINTQIGNLFLTIITIFVLNIGNVKTQIVWGLREGYELLSGNWALLSLKMIDVESANIESQKTQVVELSKLLDIVTPLTLEVIDEITTTAVFNQDNSSQSLAASQSQTNSNRRQPADQNLKTTEQFVANAFSETTDDDRTVFIFAGYPSAKKNPTAQIYVDGTRVGTGDLYQGFKVYYPDNHTGNHKIKIKRSEKVSPSTYNINTKKINILLYNIQKRDLVYT